MELEFLLLAGALTLDALGHGPLSLGQGTKRTAVSEIIEKQQPTATKLDE